MRDASLTDAVRFDAGIIGDVSPVPRDITTVDERGDEVSPDVQLPDEPRDTIETDAPVADVECRVDLPFGAIYDCRPAIDRVDPDNTTDPYAIFACCAGRCSGSTGCTRDRTQGNGCGRDPPCDTAAGMRCCYELPLDEYHCVPRNTGRCNRFP